MGMLGDLLAGGLAGAGELAQDRIKVGQQAEQQRIDRQHQFELQKNLAVFQQGLGQQNAQIQHGMAKDLTTFQTDEAIRQKRAELGMAQPETKWSPFTEIMRDGKPTVARVDQYGNPQIIGEAPPPKPGVSVNVGGEQESKFQQTLGTEQAKQLVEWQNRAAEAQTGLERLAKIEELLSEFQTGKMAKVASILGIPDADREALQSGLSQTVLDLADQMKGVLSDRDMAVLFETAPNIGYQPDANRKILELFRVPLENAYRRGTEATEYAERRGTLSGFRIGGGQSQNGQQAMRPPASAVPQQQNEPQPLPQGVDPTKYEGKRIQLPDGKTYIIRNGMMHPVQ